MRSGCCGGALKRQLRWHCLSLTRPDRERILAFMKPKRPRDTNQLAKLIVGLTTREVQDTDPNAGKDLRAIERGRTGGLKGGKARAKKLTTRQRRASARKAARARWSR
jgi:hypothetical protein